MPFPTETLVPTMSEPESGQETEKTEKTEKAPQLVRAIHRATGQKCDVHISEFNEQDYQRIEGDEDAKDKAAAAASAKEHGISTQTRDEPAAMSIEALKKLPEWRHIDGTGTKGEIVDKLLAVRARLSSKTPSNPTIPSAGHPGYPPPRT